MRDPAAKEARAMTQIAQGFGFQELIVITILLRQIVASQSLPGQIPLA